MKHTFSRPIFWPLVLIAIGTLWLLGNYGVISDLNLSVLLRFWPVLLIALGLDLIVRSRWPIAGNLIALATVTLMVVAVIFAPRMGLAAPQAGMRLSNTGARPSRPGRLGLVIGESSSRAGTVSYPAGLTSAPFGAGFF